MSTASGSGSPLPKWQLALAVGAPVALGLGYMYYKNSSSKPVGRPGGKSKGGAGKENGTAKDKQLSVDGDESTKNAARTVPENEVRISTFSSERRMFIQR